MEDIDADQFLDPELVASVMETLNTLEPQRPPQDEYAGDQQPPPAYGNFRDAYIQWCTADKAKLALAAHDKDPVVAAANKELDEAKGALKDMKVKRYSVVLSEYC
jgi:hypothetical protein